MTDHDALVRAICEHPDDDTPRLVYADFLEEAGEPDRAAFVRAQVELARTPAWEPFAVFCRHRRPEWSTGAPFRRTLPLLPEGGRVAWDERPFRRGLGWRVNVRASVMEWDSVAEKLFERAPVGEVLLNLPAVLDDWRRLFAAGWVRRLRVLHLDGASPVEPTRVLSAAPEAAGLTDLHFHRSTSPGLDYPIADLLKTPVGAGLRGLHFRVGSHAHLEHLIDALTHDGAGYERLTLALMELGPGVLRRWCDRGGPHGLTELDLRQNPLGAEGVRVLADGLAGSSLHTLGLSGVSPTASGLEALGRCEGLAGLRRLDLSRNPLTPRALRVLSLSHPLAGLRSLDLTSCGVGDKGVRHLTRAKFWPNLVELDLRENPVSGAGARYLLDAEVSADLTALALDADQLGADTRAALRRKFGDRVVLHTDRA